MGNTPDFTGWSAGVGVGYVNTNLSNLTTITMFSGAGAASIERYRRDSIKGTISPLVDASYFSVYNEEWLFGIKALYKYLGVQHPYLTWAGVFSNGASQEISMHTKLVQELFVTFDIGAQFDKWMTYLGVGPAVTGVQHELRADVLAATSTTFQYVEKTRKTSLWGVAGQIGFEYMLPKQFSVDFSYNLIASPRRSSPNLILSANTLGFYTIFGQRIELLEQGLNITVNKYFA